MNWKEKFWNEELSKIALETQEKLTEVFWTNKSGIEIQLKDDRSIVTEIDHFISDLVKNKIINCGAKEVCFYSEEDYEALGYPAVILDPIDGTSQIAKGQSDCCISLAIMNSCNIEDEENLAWIYNPFTNYEINSREDFVLPKTNNTAPYLGLISKSDFKKGIFDNLDLPANTILYPKGSIALKLAMLASGLCDFVFSRTPKNIWDIAAGMILLKRRGYNTYTINGEITSFDSDRVEGPMLWCKEAHYNDLEGLLRH